MNTELAEALLCVLEGERLTAYKDSGGVLTIGFGHTNGVTAGQNCDHAQAIAWLEEDDAPLFALLGALSPAEIAAYVSFGYNCGRCALRAVLSGADSISNPRHTTDRHGNVLPGLVARRRLEMSLIKGSSSGK